MRATINGTRVEAISFVAELVIRDGVMTDLPIGFLREQEAVYRRLLVSFSDFGVPVFRIGVMSFIQIFGPALANFFILHEWLDLLLIGAVVVLISQDPR